MRNEVKLTDLMKVLLDAVRENSDPERPWVECNPKEWRTAKALERHGLLECSDRGYAGYFEARLIPPTPNAAP